MADIEKSNEQRKQEQVYNRYKRKPSSFIIAVIFSIVCGYTFFFLSPRVFHKRSETLNTAIGEVQNLNEDISFSVKKWTYSKSQNIIETLLDVKNVSFTYKNSDFSYYAICNHLEESKGIVECAVSSQIDDFSYLSLWIYNIPEDFNSCSLYIYIKPEKLSTADAAKTTDEVPNIQLSVSIDKADKVDKIKKKTYKQYKIEEYQREIKFLNHKIQKNCDNIDNLYNEITSLNMLISKTKKSELYQSDSEVEKSENLIKGYKEDIEDKEKDINNLKISNTKLYKDINEYKDLIGKIKRQE